MSEKIWILKIKKVWNLTHQKCTWGLGLGAWGLVQNWNGHSKITTEVKKTFCLLYTEVVLDFACNSSYKHVAKQKSLVN